MSNPSTASKIPLDSVSFIFGQVISQIDYLFESGHLSQENYSTIAAALLQNTPSSTPPQTFPAPNQSGTITSEPSHYGSGYFPTTSDQHIPPPSQIGNVSSQSSSNAVKKASTPSLLSFRSKSSKGKSKTVESPLPTTPFEEAEEPQLGRINKGVRSALQGG